MKLHVILTNDINLMTVLDDIFSMTLSTLALLDGDLSTTGQSFVMVKCYNNKEKSFFGSNTLRLCLIN